MKMASYLVGFIILVFLWISCSMINYSHSQIEDVSDSESNAKKSYEIVVLRS